jgi:hypothetical protein
MQGHSCSGNKGEIMYVGRQREGGVGVPAACICFTMAEVEQECFESYGNSMVGTTHAPNFKTL